MSIQNVIVATKNAGKIREIRQILGENVNVCTMSEAGFTGEIDETGTTFEDNALIKASTIYEAYRNSGHFDLVISDDSGIEIDFFDKKPGVYSSRWLGEDTPYDVKNQIVLDKMKDAPDDQRTARYVCAIAAILKNGEAIIVKETAEGRIAKRNRPITVEAAWIRTLVRDVRICANLFLTKPHTKHAMKPHTRKKNEDVASEIPTFSR